MTTDCPGWAQLKAAAATALNEGRHNDFNYIKSEMGVDINGPYEDPFADDGVIATPED